jgi:teichoic acid transport system permease protein
MASVHHEPVPQLRDVQARAPLGAYLRSIHDRRAYIWNVAVNELRHRQITNVLGNLWHLLNPALTIGVYYLIFGLLLETDRGVDNFLLFITVGLFIFQFTQKGTTEGAKSIVTNMGVIKAVNFPRALLPLTSTVTELLAMIPTLVVMFGVALVSGASPSLRWFGVLPLIGVQFVFTLGCALIAARLTTHFVDTLQILPFVFRLILYASGVIFSVDAYVDQGGLAYTLFVLNPVYCYISIARWSVIGTPMRDELIVSGTIWAFVTLVVGLLWFRANEERYARD